MPRSRRAAPAATPDDILRAVAPEVRALADALRAIVKDTVPDAEERAYPGWKGIGYVDAQAGYFCGIFPQRDAVKLGFERGFALDDPDGLLTGGGRQVRYAVFRLDEPLPRAAIERLLRDALTAGSIR